MFVVLDFCFFRNIFGRSTLSDDFFELLRMLLGILVGDQPFFRCSLLFVSEYYRQVIEKTFLLQDNLNRFDLHIVETLKRN